MSEFWKRHCLLRISVSYSMELISFPVSLRGGWWHGSRRVTSRNKISQYYIIIFQKLWSDIICMSYCFLLAADIRCYQVWGLSLCNNGTGRLLDIGKAVDTQVVQGAGTALWELSCFVYSDVPSTKTLPWHVL
jgi:uncharacterized Fe-S cluster-containing radical SAM superfamily protein